MGPGHSFEALVKRYQTAPKPPPTRRLKSLKDWSRAFGCGDESLRKIAQPLRPFRWTGAREAWADYLAFGPDRSLEKLRALDQTVPKASPSPGCPRSSCGRAPSAGTPADYGGSGPTRSLEAPLKRYQSAIDGAPSVGGLPGARARIAAWPSCSPSTTTAGKARVKCGCRRCGSRPSKGSERYQTVAGSWPSPRLAKLCALYRGG